MAAFSHIAPQGIPNSQSLCNLCNGYSPMPLSFFPALRRKAWEQRKGEGYFNLYLICQFNNSLPAAAFPAKNKKNKKTGLIRLQIC